MERLTQKRNEKNKHLQMCIGWYELPTLDYYVRLINETPNQMYSKLGQLEDIEEELGIDLIIFLKALKDGIYHNQYCGNTDFAWDFKVDIKNKRFYYHYEDMGASCDLYCYFKDYGKTWALTKEELVK